MTAEIVTLRQRNGSTEFDCILCGAHIFSFALAGDPDRRPVCAMCRFLESVSPEDAREIAAHIGHAWPGRVAEHPELTTFDGLQDVTGPPLPTDPSGV